MEIVIEDLDELQEWEVNFDDPNLNIMMPN